MHSSRLNNETVSVTRSASTWWRVAPRGESPRLAGEVEVEPGVALAAAETAVDDTANFAKQPADRDVVGVVGGGELMHPTFARHLGESGEHQGAEADVLPICCDLHSDLSR